MAAVAKLPVYLSIAGATPVEVGALEIEAGDDGLFTITSDGIAGMLRAAADAYDAIAAEPEQDDAEGVPDAAPHR